MKAIIIISLKKITNYTDHPVHKFVCKLMTSTVILEWEIAGKHG